MTTHVADHPRPRTGPRGDAPPRARLAALLLPDEQRARYRLYALVAVLLWLVALGLVLARAHVKRTNVDFAVGDAVGYYAYLPSLVIDGGLSYTARLF